MNCSSGTQSSNFSPRSPQPNPSPSNPIPSISTQPTLNQPLPQSTNLCPMYEHHRACCLDVMGLSGMLLQGRSSAMRWNRVGPSRWVHQAVPNSYSTKATPTVRVALVLHGFGTTWWTHLRGPTLFGFLPRARSRPGLPLRSIAVKQLIRL